MAGVGCSGLLEAHTSAQKAAVALFAFQILAGSIERHPPEVIAAIPPSHMTPLQKILTEYRSASQTEREKGTYFEELIRTYFRNEPKYASLYSDVWLFADWAKDHKEIAKDTGIDLVAQVAGTDEYHAIQCKCYGEDYRVKKSDIDSFFTASGKKPLASASSSPPRMTGAKTPNIP